MRGELPPPVFGMLSTVSVSRCGVWQGCWGDYGEGPEPGVGWVDGGMGAGNAGGTVKGKHR